MKKILLVFILSFVVLKNVYAISASSYVAIDEDSGRVLEGININQERLIASITKIMTAIIAIENGNLDEEITVGDEVLKAYGSAIYIETNEKITLRDLLYGLMLRSGNDAALVIAKNVSGSMENFTSLMNQKVNDLNLKNTIFYNNHGLEDNYGENKSTAYDMALIMRYAMQNEEFRKITSTKNYIVKTNYKTYTWKNKNKLIHTYDYITGGKTGYTLKAKRTLVTSASKDNKNVIVVTLNDGNDFNDHITLYEKIFKEYNSYKILEKNNFIIENSKYENYYIYEDYNVLLTPNERKNISIKVNFENERISDVIGKVSVYLKDTLLYEENIYSKKEEITVEKLSFFKKIINWIRSW